MSNLLILNAWAGGVVHSFPQFSPAIKFPYSDPNEIGHYFCNIFPLLKGAYFDTYIAGVFVVVKSGLVTLVTFMVLFFHMSLYYSL